MRLILSCLVALSVVGCRYIAAETQLTPQPSESAEPTLSASPALSGSPVPTASAAPSTQPSPSEQPTPEPTPSAPIPTVSALPSEVPSATPLPGELQLDSLTWSTATDPFDGTSNDNVMGLFINPDSELVAWGSYQSGRDYTLERGTAFYVTSDGATWDDNRLGAPGKWLRFSDVASGPGGFVAVADEGGIASAWRSEDGVDWTRSVLNPQPTLEFEYLMAVAAGSDGYLAVGSYGGEQGHLAGWFSATGAEWTLLETNLPQGWFEDVVASADGGFVAVGGDHSGNGAQAAVWRVSADGSDWKRGEITGPRGTEELNNVHSFAGGYLAFGMYAEPGDTIWCKGCSYDPDLWRVYTSPDGRSWNRDEIVGVPGATPALSWYGAVEPWGDGLLAVGHDREYTNRVWLSADGIAWEPVGDPVDNADEAGYYDLLITETYLAVGGSGGYGGLVSIGTSPP